MRREMQNWIKVGLVAVSCLFAPTAFAGDMQVIESNVDKYPVGLILPDTAPMQDLPTDGRVRVLKLSSQTTRTYEGRRSDRAGPIGGTRGIKPKKGE